MMVESWKEDADRTLVFVGRQTISIPQRIT
jgi:hypothetical protein